jgi:hypothetical protein
MSAPSMATEPGARTRRAPSIVTTVPFAMMSATVAGAGWAAIVISDASHTASAEHGGSTRRIRGILYK